MKNFVKFHFWQNLNVFSVQKLIFGHFSICKKWNLVKKNSWGWFIWFDEFFWPELFLNFLARCVPIYLQNGISWICFINYGWYVMVRIGNIFSFKLYNYCLDYCGFNSNIGYQKYKPNGDDFKYWIKKMSEKWIIFAKVN